jgi:hypothetical protein
VTFAPTTIGKQEGKKSKTKRLSSLKFNPSSIFTLNLKVEILSSKNLKSTNLVFCPSTVKVILGHVNTPPATYAISLTVDGQKDKLIPSKIFQDNAATFEI